MGTAPAQATSISSTPVTNSSHTPDTRWRPPKAGGNEDLIGALREAATSESRPVDSVLNAVADAARILSGADGIAIALRGEGKIICRARSGAMAPELGAQLTAESGISGECLRAANILFCHDALSDERVDAEVCRGMGMRSIVAVPLRGAMGMAGILEAFASRPNAFDGDALNLLRTLSEIAEKAYARERGENCPSARAGTIVKAAARRSRGIAVPKSDPERNNSSSRIWIMAGVAVALLLTFCVAWWSWHQPDEIVSTAEAANPSTVADASSHQSSTGAASEPAVTPKPGPGIVAGEQRGSHPGLKNNLLRNAAAVEPEPVSSPSSLRSATSLPPKSMAAEVSTVSKFPAETSEAPPTIDLAKSASISKLTSITVVSAAVPKLAAPVSQGVIEPKLVHKVEPSYPAKARAERLSGSATLNAKIAEDGSIREVTVLNGIPELAEAAKAAIQQWRYAPARLNGNPVAVDKQITVVFTLPE